MQMIHMGRLFSSRLEWMNNQKEWKTGHFAAGILEWKGAVRKRPLRRLSAMAGVSVVGPPGFEPRTKGL